MSKGKPFVCNVSEMNPANNPDGLSWILINNDYMIAGRHKIAPGHAHPPNSHENEEECFYVLAGTGVAIVGETEIPVTPGTFIYVPRNTRHSMKNTGQDYLEYLFFGAYVEPSK
ncbi:MAG: cupin domain-containing protein [Firmicutes bacterium]|nr:cupin domain-containing protein [Bacillota bacterium]